MPFAPLPTTAAWRHRDARDGFEVAYFQPLDHGYHLAGCTTAVEGGQTWVVDYDIVVDARWTTRSARITGRCGCAPTDGAVGTFDPAGPGAPADGSRRHGTVSRLVESDRLGHWTVDGQHAPALDGCLDVDLESSALTNALPTHRLALDVGGHADAPAAYVRASGLAVERLEQTYRRVATDGTGEEYDYRAPAVDFAGRLVYDEAGLLLHYPGIADRAA